MKLNWGLTLVVGFGTAGSALIWTIYNLFVPVFLQGGTEAFATEGGAAVVGFGLGAGLTGLIMTLDNIMALLVVPVVGYWSDRTRTPIGRRYPFLLVGTPIVAVAFALIALPVALIRVPGGGIAANAGAFAGLMAVVVVMLVGISIHRTPARALLNDLTPSPLRSKANGVAEFASAILAVTAALGVAQLFDVRPWLPFVVGAGLFVLVNVVMFTLVRERDTYTTTEAPRRPREMLASVPPDARRSLLLLLGAVFAFSYGYNTLETFYSSYAVAELGATPGSAARNFAAALVAFVIFAIPAGYIGERVGRKPTILTGLAIFGAALGAVAVVPGLSVNAPVLAVGGMAWALIVVNGLPMVVDVTRDDQLIGTYTGLYYFASQGASIAAPILTGALIDAAGQDYNMLFVVTPAAFVLAMGCMLFVTRGEHHDAPARLPLLPKGDA